MSAPEDTSPRAHILVVEDSAVFREMQGLLLGHAGFGVSLHERPQTALETAAGQHFDLVVIDYELPDMNGQVFMHELRKLQPEIAVIFVSGSLTLELAIQLSSEGVAGIFNKPANPKSLLEKINETLARHSARDTAARVGSGSPLSPARRGNANSAAGSPTSAQSEPTAERLAYAPRFVLGTSDKFREFTHRLWKVRDFRSVLLLQGESGSPFELLARELAEISIFRDGPIMTCAAGEFEPRRLIEVLAPSLLSHDAGTLVVTDVDTFSPEQQKTLDHLMTGRNVFLPFARRFRLVLAASSVLSQRVDEGLFDETLYYKVSSLSLVVPTLRELRGDIADNARNFLRLHLEAGNVGTPTDLSQDAADWIEQQDWPGNFDEIRTVLLKALQFADGEVLTLDAISAGWHYEGTASPIAADSPAASAVSLEELPTGETRPPFPIASDLAAEAVEESAVAPIPAAAPAEASVARAPAGRLFARAAAPANPVAVQSQFRPASINYDFAKRLAESIAAAEACVAH